MRRLSLCLDSLPALREAAGAAPVDLGAAATIAELAGVDALRLGVGDDLRPVSEADVHALRRSARVLELRMAPTQSMLKVALETRPDTVLLASEGWEGNLVARPLDPAGADASLGAVIRTLEEAGLAVGLLVAPELESVKAAHGLGVQGVELYTGSTVDLPARERRPTLDALGDAVRLASKLRLQIGLGGGLDFRSTGELLRAAPAADTISVGRSLIARALLVGLDRAARDFLALTR